MAVTIEQIKKMLKKMFKEFRKETEDMIKQQEKNVLNIISSSTKILYERLDKIEMRINENSKQIKLIEKEIEDIKVSLNFHEQLIEKKIRSVITSQDKCNTINVTQNNESAFSKITNKLREIEDRSRRNNLRIDGIKESEGESWNDSETKSMERIGHSIEAEKTIDAEYQRIIDMELQHWRGVIKRIMSIIKLLASQCLAFRGSTEHLF
nr:uncharacterized protein LOC124813986 [Hydra vulgaris]